MKKLIFCIAVIVIMVVFTFIYLENSKKSNSYSTPEEALRNNEHEYLDVLEIVDPKIYEEVAYVFYYSQFDAPKDYLAAGIINKNKYGWRVDEVIGVGSIDKNNEGMASGMDEHIVGFAGKEVAKVKMGTHEAAMIEIENEYMNAFLFHGVDSELLRELEFEYFDKEGNEL
ncbi:hypothetical protein [Oceanobacillus damuensis]|uniref:hypothetical protein n=1 Tax=Oceanobacillus damuensis TaxID=937928 RepID=UPI00082A158A|nr:hypothetical protein [Oceanobacillus damuensis]